MLGGRGAGRPRVRAGRLIIGAAVLAGGMSLAGTPPAGSASTVPKFSHVVEVFLENESATSTWDADPTLHTLASTYAYIPNFFGAGHASLDNYQAAFGAVTPTTQGKADCIGMQYGSCILPVQYPTIGGLLDAAGYSWKVYSEGEAGAPRGGPCLHALDRSLPDFYQGPGTNGYATRHNPAPWFDSILTNGGSEAYCQAHNPDLAQLTTDEQNGTLPTFSFVEPDTCHDGHDTSSSGGCALDPEGPTSPSGNGAIDAWLPGFISQLTSSKAWDANSVLFLTFDEGAATDTAGCAPCGDGSAGGRVGAVVISPLAKAQFTSTWEGDHYGFLATLEASLGLPTLKATATDPSVAAQINDGDPGVTPLTDVWTVNP